MGFDYEDSIKTMGIPLTGSLIGLTTLSGGAVKPIVWDQSFSVGVRKMDEQHREIIKMINYLIENSDRSADFEPVAEVLSRMTRYANYHFKAEERLMVEYGYSDEGAQEKEHTEFKKRTASFCFESMGRETTIATEVLAYLRDWWMSHILESDMKYKAFFAGKGLD
jgi:hemerythrin-like metal-binding protein